MIRAGGTAVTSMESTVIQVRQLLKELQALCEMHDTPDGGPAVVRTLPTESQAYVLWARDQSTGLATRSRRKEILQSLVNEGPAVAANLVHAMSSSPMHRVRAELAHALGDIGNRVALVGLIQHSKLETSYMVLREVMAGLTRMQCLESRAALQELERRYPDTVVARLAREELSRWTFR